MRKFLILSASVAVVAGLYAGPASAAGKTTTECSGTLSGTYDRIVVPDGATCTLQGATVDGNVTVGSGSSLYTMDATIEGNVMSRAAATVRLIDTNVGGNIMISRTTGTVKIGSKGCKVDPMAARNVMLHDNLGAIAVCDMTIGRNLELKGNADRIGLFRNMVGSNILVFQNTGKANRLRDNTAERNLNCHGNTDKVIVSGNSASKLMGQCSV